jgi:hypothetical protein
MLPTPTAGEHKHGKSEKYWDNRIHKGRQEDLSMMLYKGMLPTPTAMDSTNATATMKSTQVKEGSMHSVTLARAMTMGILPTPTASDQYSGTPLLSENYPRETDLKHYVSQQIGKTSQLNPRFVAEMMGFPPNWTELPFLNGEQNQLRDTATQ